MEVHSLYFHIPFCLHRCAYCDFNTYAGMDDKLPDYIGALCREMELVSGSLAARLPVHTIFFGGGTPSLLPPADLATIFSTISKCFEIQPNAEITMEANPGTVSLDYLKHMRGLGVNRISFGVQSANRHELDLLTRQHTLQDVLNAVNWSRSAGFDNLSLDLIFGLPSQTLRTWRQTMETILELKPDHLSLYALTVEKGTPLNRWVGRGLVVPPDDDDAAEMYEWASECLEQKGWSQYEISNWAQPGSNGQPRICVHNLQYWLNRPYLGFGAGAHGYADGVRTANTAGIQPYIDRVQNGMPLTFPASAGNVTAHFVTPDEEMAEMMMVGLRLTSQGVDNADFQARFGVSLAEQYKRSIRRLQASGLLEWVDGENSRLRLTKSGRLLGNRVFREFV